MEKKILGCIGQSWIMGNNLCQGKNDYLSGGMFYSLFLAPKINYSLIFIESGFIENHKTFKGFNDS